MRINSEFSPTIVKKVLAFLISALALVLFSPISAQASAPTIQTATVDGATGRTITLQFDDLSGSTSTPPRTDFSVTGSVQGSVSVSNVYKSGSTIRLTVASIISGGQTATLTYVPTSNIPTNASNEALAGFTTAISNPGAASVPGMAADETYVNWSNPRAINTYFGASGTSITCSLTASNFQVKVNGAVRTISSISGSDCGNTISINLSSPLVANDNVTLSYIPSSGSIVSIFGTVGAAATDMKVGGIPDTIAPTITVPSVSNFHFGQGGNIALNSNESGSWQVTTDRTLSFQIFGTPPQLLVSSILPVGTYTVGLTAADDSGNTTTRTITVNILAAGATPSPTPTASLTPTPTGAKALVYKTCTLLIKKYPGGVAQSYKVRNKGASMSRIPYVDAAIYKANIKLDTDKDGLACER